MSCLEVSAIGGVVAVQKFGPSVSVHVTVTLLKLWATVSDSKIGAIAVSLLLIDTPETSIDIDMSNFG